MSRDCTGSDHALLTDLYELTMMQAYYRESMTDNAVFSLFFRRLPAGRNYVLACGLGAVLDYLQNLHFTQDDLDYLATQSRFGDDFLHWLGALRFTGAVRAVPEGSVVFPQEPLLEISAPLPQAQLVESYVMNQMHLQSVLASKAARVVAAAAGRPVVDFGMRRMHGADAALQGARAYHIAGLAGTSNVLAGKRYGIPITGTMAHSYVQAHADEMSAFRAFTRSYPQTTLLVDTYDTLAGVRRVIALAAELGADFNVQAIRLDSGDLAGLARRSRQLLDAAGLQHVKIMASGGLGEEKIAGLLAQGAPIDGFGVGTHMGVSEDAPTLDLAYKLTEYAGTGRLKDVPGKPILPGPKQVYRQCERGEMTGDVITRADEHHPGRPLLRQVMAHGRIVAPDAVDLATARARAAAELAALPAAQRALAPAGTSYPVHVSEALQAEHEAVLAQVRASAGARPAAADAAG
ncbi:MAG TPA: nicotinate phosphoribosyltransferase [Gammaproteobacteria bacterium]|nr:nicotinate phosphoribosyltransferase [Gammaproteobacteria bacterium]